MIKLINDDSRNALKELIDGGVEVDLVVTSPPYDNLRNYNDSLRWDECIFKEIARLLYNVTVDGGVIVWIVNDGTMKGSRTGTSFKQALYFMEIGFNLHDTMIFAKNNPLPQIWSKRYTDAFEYMFIFSKGTPKTCNALREPCKYKGLKLTNYKKITSKDTDRRYDKEGVVNEDKIKGNIWYYNIGDIDTKKWGHPAMFPVDLAKDHILSWSNPNELVLDPFMGSGTVGVACQENNRNFIGIELEEKYYLMAKERTKTYQSKLIY